MPKQSEKYRLGYFATGELWDAETETRRWNTVDAQIRGLYEMLGNGVVDGWDITQSSTDPLSVNIGPGSGILSFVSASTTSTGSLGPLVPGATSYIFASISNSTYWTGAPIFTARMSMSPPEGGVFLGSVQTSATSVTSIDTSERANVGIDDAMRALIKAHRHIGGSQNPDQVDLASEVQGQIGLGNLPDLDTSVIKTGLLDPNRFPLIDHITGLSNQGTLSHAQLDSFVESLLGEGKRLMGETALTNFLQLVLALKHQWPEVDEYLVNEIALIPGISPDSLIDTVNTTATVDTRPASEGGQHTISGAPAPARKIYTKTWDTEEEFEEAERDKVSVDGDLMRLVPTEARASIEDFENVSDWSTEILNLSSTAGTFSVDPSSTYQGNSSGKLDLNTTVASNMSFTMKKVFTSQDWSSYNGVVFFLKTEAIRHGDLYFFFEDAVGGSQESFTLILPHGEPTINRDSLEAGWREIHVDISKFNRAAVTKVGFYTSTDKGWEPAQPFTMNVDDMYLTTGNTFVESGTARLTYSVPFPQNFWRVRREGTVPSGTSLRIRTRTADSLSEFDPLSPNPAQWSSYNSSDSFTISTPTSPLKQCIQLEILFESSPDRKASPELSKLFLDTYVASSEEMFVFDDKDSWESGKTVNLDTSTVPGEISVAGVNEVNDVYYGAQGVAIQTDEDLEPLFTMAGTALPRSTAQVLAGDPPSFGQVSGLARGEDGTVWVADTDNDRVVQIRKDGSLVMGLYGSFLEAPPDPYGTEERGPGSNTDVESVDESSGTEGSTPVAPIHSIYNPDQGLLSVIFNADLETVHDTGTTLDKNKFFLTAGANRVYFSSDAVFSLLGIDGVKYDGWKNSTNPYLPQFTFASHVLQIALSQADIATVGSITDFETPSLTVSSPHEQQITYSSTVTLVFIPTNWVLGGTDNNRIRYRVDSSPYQFTSVASVTLNYLSEGTHTLSASLVDGQGNPLENPEASVQMTFVTLLSPWRLPFIWIDTPSPSQILPSSPVSVSFTVLNYPITPYGPHLRCSVDGAAATKHKDLSPIPISGLSQGAHSVRLFLADEYGNQVPGDYTSSTINFFVGATGKAEIRLCVGKGAIRGAGREEATACLDSNIPVDAANITMVNMYSPVDVQFVSSDVAVAGPSGDETVLVAKLRSPSWTVNLSTPQLSSGSNSTVQPDTAIFGTKFMDGHSVIEYGMDGGIAMTNNAAKFADTKANAKLWLGSAEKTAVGELMMADSSRHRAIITQTDMGTQATYVAWEYKSDRNVVDFHVVEQYEASVSVTETSVSPASLTVKQGTSVVWRNNSAVPVWIYSGTTTPEKFADDPDLSLYGDVFKSEEIQPGDSYSFTFRDIGKIGWFVYPFITTGTTAVSSARVSDSDQYLILENDPSVFVFGSRLIKVDAWGNVVWSFGEAYLARPRDARPMIGGSVILSV